MKGKISTVILGAGGHARVLIDCLQYYPDVAIVGILDSALSLHGESIYGIPVLGEDDLIGELVQRGTTHFVVGLGSIGNTLPRKKLFDFAFSYGLVPLTVKHPTAVISNSAVYGDGCQFLPGCIVNTEANLGVNVIVNSGGIVEHNCIIGNHAHIATGAKLAGGVQVGRGVHIGAGATIRQNIFIGDFSIVGAGAVVVENVPSNTTVMGVPAKKSPGKVF